MTISERLRQYNRWRRGDKRMKQPDPTEIGELLDSAADRLEVLEREHQEYFDRWHDERRKREALELAPDGFALVPLEPTAAQLDTAVAFALNVKLSEGYMWSHYMRDVYKRMIGQK